MVQFTKSPFEEMVDWHFQVVEQHNHARYGTFGEVYFKQFLPGGTLASALHPPKAIPKRLYDHAKKISEA